jgi:hypothetical protein
MNEPKITMNDATKPKDQKDKMGQPEPKMGDPKMGDPKMQEPTQVTKKEDKDKKGTTGKASLDNDKTTKNDKTAEMTVAGLVKDIWGHLPKAKRQEMDAYSQEQFMPQYEQLLRQYFQNIATKGKSKGD